MSTGSVPPERTNSAEQALWPAGLLVFGIGPCFAVRSDFGFVFGRLWWCFGGRFPNRPWLVQVVDNCDFRQAPAVASELLAGAGTDELSKQDTDEQSTITEPAGGTCGLCVPSSLTVNGGYDLGV